MRESIANHLRKLAWTWDWKKALNFVLKDPNWEKAVDEFYAKRKPGQKEALAKELLFSALLFLSQQTGAQTANELKSNIKEHSRTEAVQEAKPTVQDVKKISESIPLLASSSEMKILTNPIKIMRPGFGLFTSQLEGKMNQASTDSTLKEKLKSFALRPAEFKADLIAHSFVMKVENTREEYTKGKNYAEGLNEYLADLGGNHPENISQLGGVISKILRNKPALLNKFFQ